jgi:hypothetical protein
MKLWSAIRYKLKKMENSVGKSWVQIEALEEYQDDVFDTEDIVQLHKEGTVYLFFVSNERS